MRKSTRAWYERERALKADLSPGVESGWGSRIPIMAGRAKYPEGPAAGLHLPVAQLAHTRGPTVHRKWS